MTLAELSLTVFALLNGGRILAYVPQMIRIYRDPHGAAAVSVATWSLFAAAHLATVSYALLVAKDHLVAVAFAMNAVGCLAIVAMTAWKRICCARPSPTIGPRLALPEHPHDCGDPMGLSNRVAPPMFAPGPIPSAHRRDEMARISPCVDEERRLRLG